MEQKLEEYEKRQNERLERIEEKLNRILELLQPIGESCEGMTSHINFVEDAYSVLRSPLDFTLNALSSMTNYGGNTERLPDLVRNHRLTDQ